MILKDLLQELKISGIKLTEVAERTGINIYTLYSITSGRKISKEKEDYYISLLYSVYHKEIVRLQVLKEIHNNQEVL